MLKPLNLHHVHVCIPKEREQEAKEFYQNVLGWRELEKPEALKANGGFWLQAGPIEWHVGVEEQQSRSKRHVALEVQNVAEVRQYLEQKGVLTQDEIPLPRVKRFSFFDPFGNRIECVENVEQLNDRQAQAVTQGLEPSLNASGRSVEELSSEKEAVIAQFGKNAHQYVTSEIHAKGNDLQDLVSSISFQPGMTALDIATGGGHVANALAPHCVEVTALDLTSEILEQARRFIQNNGHQNVSYVQGDAEKLPFPDQHFDLVTCRIAAHHFPSIPAFVQEVSRVIKPGGQFVLIDNVAPELDKFEQFYNRVEKRRDYSHVRAWKKTEWLGLIEECNFLPIALKMYDKYFKYAQWCTRMQLPASEQEALSAYMLEQDEQTKYYFQIEEADGTVTGFTGKSMLLYMKKIG